MTQASLDHIFQNWIDHHLKSSALYQEAKENLAVAVSGGPDSMALLGVMTDYAIQNQIQLHVLSVDHGLRAEAHAEINQVREFVRGKKSNLLHHETLTWKHDNPDTAVMEKARSARYELMAQYCEGYNIKLLFIAHHQDDQAETFLIRLSKGSGLDGLSAMQPIQQYNDHLFLARPFLEVTKSDLIAYCDQHKIKYAKDPSNENEKYLRPRLRASMDVLSEEGLTPKRLSLTAKRLSRARKALEEIANNAYQSCLIEKEQDHISFDFASLKSCPLEISFRVIAMALETFRTNKAYQVRMEKLEDLVDDMMQNTDFKPRTLGGCRFALMKKDKVILRIEKERAA